MLSTLATALPIGIAFGVVLERAGLGDARVIAGQFTGRDFTVVRVMFGAIVTAMLGVVLLDSAGLASASAIAIPPTDIAGQAVGAVIFGGGFALAALCPGTACVAAASGKREGLVTVAGLFVGTALVALLWPLFDATLSTGVREGARLSGDTGAGTGVVVLGVTLLAVTAFAIARRMDATVRAGTAAWWRPTVFETVALSMAVTFALTTSEASPSRPATARLVAIAAQITAEADHVDPLDLAGWIKDGRAGLRVIDVRDGLDSSTYVIPGAEPVPMGEIVDLAVAPDEHLVLYSDGGTHAAQAWALLRMRGVQNVHVLKDGMAAWEDEVMHPVPPAPGVGNVSSDTAGARFARARALAHWFGGRPRLEPAAAAGSSGLAGNAGSPGAASRRPRRRNTC